MDKMTEKLFGVLYDYNPTDRYRVVSFDEIMSNWEGISQINQLIDELIDDGYIAVKYRDGENVCYICLKKPILSAAKDQPVNVPTRSKNWSFHLVNFCVSFVASFLAMILALYLMK